MEIGSGFQVDAGLLGEHVADMAGEVEVHGSAGVQGGNLGSGHVHGGIMRLPKLGGVISPSLRLFPKYDAGQFEENGHKMVLSRGLGLHHIKLRFFNRPEISVINLSCQKAEK